MENRKKLVIYPNGESGMEYVVHFFEECKASFPGGVGITTVHKNPLITLVSKGVDNVFVSFWRCEYDGSSFSMARGAGVLGFMTVPQDVEWKQAIEDIYTGKDTTPYPTEWEGASESILSISPEIVEYLKQIN